MSSINITSARNDLYKIVQKVNETHEPIHIVGKSGSAVIVSEEDWNSIVETLYLTSIPGMRESIIEGLKTPSEKLSDQLEW